jgi:hypothetical protein
MWNRLCVRFASAACDCDRWSARVLLPFWLDARPTTGPRGRGPVPGLGPAPGAVITQLPRHWSIWIFQLGPK